MPAKSKLFLLAFPSPAPAYILDQSCCYFAQLSLDAILHKLAIKSSKLDRSYLVDFMLLHVFQILIVALEQVLGRAQYWLLYSSLAKVENNK